MTNQAEVYKCNICGNIIEVLFPGVGTLVCCGEDMHLCAPNTTDAAGEKHVPVCEDENGTIMVKVGSVPHPMLEEHYIQMIEVFTKDGVIRKYLNPGQKPEFSLHCECHTTSPCDCGCSEEVSNNEEKSECDCIAINCDCDIVEVREYCNLHGLWKGECKC
ncbi:MAG: desulfoferrodoxin FeS4 iron-binding domain-containing protein [Candidatus Gastranaerophilales bacterium]|nr:desulfoferrodoxin FeS4 iron-binding domain-containing protein [Candidatus Gastranaerophilales bacterium]